MNLIFTLTRGSLVRFIVFKNMVTQGSSTICGIVEIGKIIKTEKINAIKVYAITDGGGDQ